MAEQHPITPPPPELVELWYDAIDNSSTPWRQQLATKAARWGADTELEACCEWLEDGFGDIGDFPKKLRAARRPKPPSLAEQSLALIDKIQRNKEMWDIRDLDVVRRALERLQELEGGNG